MRLFRAILQHRNISSILRYPHQEIEPQEHINGSNRSSYEKIPRIRNRQKNTTPFYARACLALSYDRGKSRWGRTLAYSHDHRTQKRRTRSTPLFFFRDGEQFIIIGSDGGSPRFPVWWLNLQSNPQAIIQVGSEVIPVTAKRAEGEDYTRLWSIIEEDHKNFVGYQQRTTRQIPVIILTRSK